jgi:hypothetical protein
MGVNVASGLSLVKENNKTVSRRCFMVIDFGVKEKQTGPRHLRIRKHPIISYKKVNSFTGKASVPVKYRK